MASIEIPTSNNISTPGVDTSSYKLALPANQNTSITNCTTVGRITATKNSS